MMSWLPTFRRRPRSWTPTWRLACQQFRTVAPKRDGIEIGRAATATMVASRAEDGRNASVVYTRDAAPGIWQPPATGMAVPWLGFVKPLVLRSPVAVDGPDPIGSAAYAADFNEVKRLGSKASTARTAAQTETAKFFSANIVLQLRQALLLRLESHPLSRRGPPGCLRRSMPPPPTRSSRPGGSSTTLASGARSRPFRLPRPTETTRRGRTPRGCRCWSLRLRRTRTM